MTYRTFDGTSQVETITDGRFSSDGTQNLKDSEAINLGTSSDLKIFHDGSNSIINDAGTGSLLLQVGGSTKFETSATGTNVTGVHVDDGATHDGDVTFTGATANVTWDKSADDLIFADNAKAAFGTGGDLQLFHSGTNSLIDNNTGDLVIRNNVASDVGGDIIIQAKSGENSAKFTHDGSVELRYDNVKKIETASDKINFYAHAKVNADNTYDLGASGARWKDLFISNDIDINDDGKLLFGASDDLQIYHDSSAGGNYIDSVNRSLIIRRTGTATETMGQFTVDGAVDLYYDGTKKVETTSVGVKVTGNYQAVDGYHIYLGTGNDFDMFHNGSNSYIDNATGILYLRCADTYITNADGSANYTSFGSGGATVTGALTADKVVYNKGAELTIASGVITATNSYHEVDTEGDAGSDDLVTINGGVDGQLLLIRAANSSRTIVVKDASGNIYLNGSSDYSLDDGSDTLHLICIGSDWREIGRANIA